MLPQLAEECIYLVNRLPEVRGREVLVVPRRCPLRRVASGGLTTAAVSRVLTFTMAPPPKMPKPTVEQIAQAILADM